MKHLPLTIAALFLLSLLSPTTHADAPLEGTYPAQWRLTWTTDPATTATVSWSTAETGSVHQLRYRVQGDDAPAAAVLADSGRHSGGPEELHYHHARLTELTPATTYEVQMISDDNESPWFHFVTANASDRPFRLMHGGDSRSDQKARRGMNTMMANLFAQSNQNDDPSDDILALAHGGDYIVSGTNLSQWSMWLSDHELTVTDEGRLMPLIPARGNHDKGKLFNEVFGVPADDLNYYAIDLTPQVRFVTLNTETSTAGDQATWLKNELSQSRPTHRWLLAQYHKPAYPAVKGPSSALQSWVPLFEKYNVDLVCEADGHNIKRTVPIRDNQPDETGIVYIGEGGLGVPQRTPKTDRWFLQSPGMAGQGDHVFVLTFEPNQLTGQCVRVDGSIADEFTRPVRSNYQ